MKFIRIQLPILCLAFVALLGLNLMMGSHEITAPMGSWDKSCYLPGCAATPALSTFGVGFSFFLWIAIYAGLNMGKWRRLLYIPWLFIIWVVVIEVLTAAIPLPVIVENPWEGYSWISDSVYFANYTPYSIGGWPVYVFFLVVINSIFAVIGSAMIMMILSGLFARKRSSTA